MDLDGGAYDLGAYVVDMLGYRGHVFLDTEARGFRHGDSECTEVRGRDNVLSHVRYINFVCIHAYLATESPGVRDGDSECTEARGVFFSVILCVTVP